MNYNVAWPFKSSIRAPRPAAPFEVAGADRFPGADLRVRFCLPRGHVRITGWEGGWAEGHMAGWPRWPTAAAAGAGDQPPHRWGPAGLELVRPQPSQQLGAEEALTQPPGAGAADLPRALPHLCATSKHIWHLGMPRDTPEAPPHHVQEGPPVPSRSSRLCNVASPGGGREGGPSGRPQEGPAAWDGEGGVGRGAESRAGPAY